jgi:predicted metal-dependent HD superfamily phosphohydrolase
MLTKTTRAFERVKREYQVDTRCFHNVELPMTLLRALETVQDRIRSWPTIEIAVWWSKSVFVPGAPDNADKSAERMWSDLCGLAANSLLEPAATMIRHAEIFETPRQRMTAFVEGDMRYFIDAHISLFGTSTFRFTTLEDLYRKEALQVIPECRYQTQRLILLKRILQRNRIYYTDEFSSSLEDITRENISRLIHSLESELQQTAKSRV